MGTVVALVRVELDGLASPASTTGTDGRYAADKGLEGLAVVQVGARDCDGQGQTGPLVDQVDLRAVLTPIDRIRTCQIPLFKALMFTESIAQRDQSSSPRAPSSSRTGRWSLARTRALLHSENRRWAVAPEGPDDAVGSCCQVQPDVATNTIAASTSRSQCRHRLSKNQTLTKSVSPREPEKAGAQPRFFRGAGNCATSPHRPADGGRRGAAP